jgi:hypothetical protein
MEGDAPQVPTTQKVQPEVKDISQAPQQPPQQPPVVPQSPPKPTSPPKPKMRLKLKILIILVIALVSLAIGGFFLWKNISVPETGKTRKEKKEEEVYIYKGFWMPGINEGWLASHMQEMKNMGVNTVSLAVGFYFDDNKQISMDTSHIFEDIQVAHENGMKVMLNPNFYPFPKLEDLDVEELNSKIVEVAELAEEYDVELFAPLNEPENIFHPNTGEWRQDILPKVKEVYHGDIFYSGGGVGLPDKEAIAKIPEQPPGDFVGYDYIGVTFLFSISEYLEPEDRIQFADQLTLESYAQHVEGALDYMLAKAERDNCKGVIIKEFGVRNRFFLNGSEVADMLDTGWSSEEELVRANEIVLEKGKGRVAGFLNANFLGGEIPGMPGEYIEGISEAEKEVIRRYFTEIL